MQPRKIRRPKRTPELALEPITGSGRPIGMSNATHSPTNVPPTSRPRRRLDWRRGGLIAALIAALMLIQSCSGGGGNSESMDASSGSIEDAPAATEPAPAKGDLGLNQDGGDDSAAGDARGSNPLLTPQTRAVISTGTVNLSSKDVAATRLAVAKVIDALGGQVAQEETDSDAKGELTSARVVIRVPSDRFTEAMDDLEAISKVHSRTIGTEDVTTQVIDVEARVRAQTLSLARIEALLAEAASFRDVIAIEAQLTSRQAELDSLKAQQAWLADQTSMATITVYLDRLAEPKPKRDDDNGFLAGLKAGWDALSSATLGAVTLLGAVLPFAIVGLILGYPALIIWRRFTTRADNSEQTPSVASADPDPSSE